MNTYFLWQTVTSGYLVLVSICSTFGYSINFGKSKSIGARMLNKQLKFRFKNCGEGDSDLQFEHFSISPSPIQLPGPVSFKLVANVTRPLPDVVDVEIKMKKRFNSWLWMAVPCFQEYGSCYYENVDVCSAAAEVGQQDECPNKVGRYRISQSFQLPDVGSLSLYLKGDYKAIVTVLNPFSQQELACLSLEFSIAAGHSNEADAGAMYNFLNEENH